MAVSEKNKNTLWALSAGRCAICREQLVYEAKTGNGSLVGEIAHIVAQKPDGPRGESELPIPERDLFHNLILLCRKHHKIVDDQVEQFSVSTLKKKAEEHYKWVSKTLNELEEWNCNLSQLNYINVPRLSMQASRFGYELDLSGFGDFPTLYSLGWDLNKLMRQFSSLLNKLSLHALDFEKVVNFPDDRLIGATCHISNKFRTRNVPLLKRTDVDDVEFSGNLASDPHIYRSYKNFKLVLRIQPRWITTTTAFMCFRPTGGSGLFSGLFLVTEVDIEGGFIYASPLVLGLPISDLEIALRAKKINNEDVGMNRRESTSNRYNEYIDMEKAVDHGLKYIGAPEHCDICTISLEKEEFIIDGETKGNHAWAFMCAHCFDKHGSGIGWGVGQMYKKTKGGDWLLVGGFPPEDRENA